MFKAYFLSTDLFLDQCYHGATKRLRLREQVWAVLSDLAFRPTPVLFFQPCFRLLLTLMPLQPQSWSREPTWTGHCGRGICWTKSDVRHPILRYGAAFMLPGKAPGNPKPFFLSFVSCYKENLRKRVNFPWESKGCVIGNSDLFQITHAKHNTLHQYHLKTPHPT